MLHSDVIFFNRKGPTGAGVFFGLGRTPHPYLPAYRPESEKDSRPLYALRYNALDNLAWE
jgi:hypothetical protein